LGEVSYQRILAYHNTAKDEENAAQALLHYDTWTKKKLVAEVPLHRKIQYYTVVQAERTIGIIGMFIVIFCFFIYF
jgi:hypothetical protein